MIALAPKTWKIIGIGVAALVLLGLVLFGFHSCGSWSQERGTALRKANVNAVISNIENRNTVIANLKEQQAAETQALNTATSEYLDAVNATEATRIETNKALANMANVAKTNGNVSVGEFREKMRGL